MNLEQRARELFPPDYYGSQEAARGRAIQLAREYADARAEEIAAECQNRAETGAFMCAEYNNGFARGLDAMANWIRSLITKPPDARPIELTHRTEGERRAYLQGTISAMERAKDRAEKAYRAVIDDCYDVHEAWQHALDTWQKEIDALRVSVEPETREQRLEKALREIRNVYQSDDEANRLARRALEEK